MTVALLVLMGALLLAACGADEDEEDEAAPTAATSPAATAMATSTAAATPIAAEADSAVTISAREFCEEAELTITRWDLPATLSDGIERGTIELRYRLPPGAEALLVWMGVPIEVGPVTFGDLFRIDPSLQASFPNADPSAVMPATVGSHGFDLEQDGRTHTIRVPITLPTEGSFDGAAPWRWSSLATPPFALGAPEVLATFRAEGTRVRLDGRFCTPVIVPLP